MTLSTNPYKGVRDFYPEEMAVQRYIFDTWSRTAESFGYARYDASILEPAELYKAKGAENEEMVNEQTYTFTDRGEREVTLRPEMTPSVARLVAGQRNVLSWPVRWYSIPNLFRYERPQRGRLREHWQLNCDLFGSDHLAADVEIIALAHQLFLDFGATPEQFEIRVNDRRLMHRLYTALGVTEEQIPAITRLNDRKAKISPAEYRTKLDEILGDDVIAEEVVMMLEHSDEQSDVMFGLSELGITNARFDKTLARGFDYYTGTIFEIFDTSDENNRALLGGGRYDDLTALFGGEAISGIGFGMGDVTMRDFLTTHNLLPESLTATGATLTIIPMTPDQNLYAERLAREFRGPDVSVSVDFGERKVGKRITTAVDTGSQYVLVVGEDEQADPTQLTLKHLASGHETTGDATTLRTSLARD